MMHAGSLESAKEMLELTKPDTGQANLLCSPNLVHASELNDALVKG